MVPHLRRLELLEFDASARDGRGGSRRDIAVPPIAKALRLIVLPRRAVGAQPVRVYVRTVESSRTKGAAAEKLMFSVRARP